MKGTASVAYGNSFLIVCGGLRSKMRNVNPIYEYDPDNESWVETGAEIGLSRRQASAIVVDESALPGCQ